MVFLAFVQYFIVALLYTGLLELCDQLRDAFGHGPLSFNFCGFINFHIELSRQMIFFNEVFHYDPQELRCERAVLLPLNFHLLAKFTSIVEILQFSLIIALTIEWGTTTWPTKSSSKCTRRAC